MDDSESNFERELRQAEAAFDTASVTEDEVQERFDANEATQHELDEATMERKAAEAKRDHWREAVEYDRKSNGY